MRGSSLLLTPSFAFPIHYWRCFRLKSLHFMVIFLFQGTKDSVPKQKPDLYSLFMEIENSKVKIGNRGG